MTLAKFVEYIKVHLTWKNKPDQSTPILGEHMMTIESGIKANNEAIQELAAAVVSQITNDPNKIASMAALYSVNKKADDLISDLALEDVGNAVAATNWTVVASNRVMNNDLGMVYGKIIHNASVAPVWGELVATFPGFKSYYDMPLPLYCTDGNLYITANLNAAGQIKLYNPDLAKLNTKDKVYSFTAVYLRKK